MNACVLFSILAAVMASITTVLSADDTQTSTRGGSPCDHDDDLVLNVREYYGEKESSDVTEKRDKRGVVRVGRSRFGAGAAGHRHRVRHRMDKRASPAERCSGRRVPGPDGKCVPIPCPDGKIRDADGKCPDNPYMVSVVYAPPRCPPPNKMCYESEP